MGGYGFWIAGCVRERKRSDCFSVELVTHGDGIFEQDGKSYIVGKDAIMLLRKHVNHRYGTGPSGRLHKRIMKIDGSCIEQMLGTIGLNDESIALRMRMRGESPF
jgi:hypothetical protein